MVSYRALTAGTVVCIKTATPGSPHLRREALMLSRLASPHVPRLLADGVDSGFIVEEYIAGNLLAALARPALIAALPQIMTGLTAATDAFTAAHPPLIHRDIKLANLCLAGDRLVVFDFGSAEFEGHRAPDSRRCRRMKLGRGTHHAQPLEQLLGLHTQDRRVDIFAAAGVIYWILTGRPPYLNIYPDEDTSRVQYTAAEERLEDDIVGWPAAVREQLWHALRASPEQRSCSLKPLAEAILTCRNMDSCSKSR
ncbi:MAG: hypothetical protein PHI34_05470 [Acidobacteriota bacterium]|nr:hypothetical protein [Acidobacteriota bacterium]